MAGHIGQRMRLGGLAGLSRRCDRRAGAARAPGPRPPCGFGPRLAKDVVDVSLDGARSDVELGRDLTIRPAGGNSSRISSSRSLRGSRRVPTPHRLYAPLPKWFLRLAGLVASWGRSSGAARLEGTPRGRKRRTATSARIKAAVPNSGGIHHSSTSLSARVMEMPITARLQADTVPTPASHASARLTDGEASQAVTTSKDLSRPAASVLGSSMTSP